MKTYGDGEAVIPVGQAGVEVERVPGGLRGVLGNGSRDGAPPLLQE